ncbi:hypothetical protein D3C87_2173930 [compost metagenome]
MELVLQRIEHQKVQIGQPADRFRRKIADIAAIGKVADAKSQRMNVAVKLHQRLECDRPAGA